MGLNAYIQGFNSLESIDRAPGYFKYHHHSVADHCFRTAELAQMMGDIEEVHGNKKINWKALYEKSLNHDYTERFIGDIKTPVKYATPQLRKMIGDVEETMTTKFIKDEIPEEFQEIYTKRLSEGKDDTLEGKILSICDKLDLLYEAYGEIELGNPNPVYMQMFKESLETIKKFDDLVCVQYFIKKILPDLFKGDFAGKDKMQRIAFSILLLGDDQVKFQCSSCGLRMDSLHFKQEGLMNPKLTSICDICITRNLNPEDYANDAVATFAQSLLYTFVGAKKQDQSGFIVKNKKDRKKYEAFLQDYDGNEIARQQIKRSDLNLAVIKSEDGKLNYVPNQGVTFEQNLKGMGLEINFQLNEVDFIDRERIRAKYKYRCQYCGRRGHSVDHKDPVSLSHNNSLDNLTLACAECNRIKSDMPYKLFIQLNDQISEINKKLVKYEDALVTLREEFEHRRRYLAAQVHLKGVINDPELNAIRKQNKSLQDAIDSLQSDYDDLRQTRKTYFDTGWKLARIKENKDII